MEEGRRFKRPVKGRSHRISAALADVEARLQCASSQASTLPRINDEEDTPTSRDDRLIADSIVCELEEEDEKQKEESKHTKPCEGHDDGSSTCSKCCKHRDVDDREVPACVGCGRSGVEVGPPRLLYSWEEETNARDAYRVMTQTDQESARAPTRSVIGSGYSALAKTHARIDRDEEADCAEIDRILSFFQQAQANLPIYRDIWRKLLAALVEKDRCPPPNQMTQLAWALACACLPKMENIDEDYFSVMLKSDERMTNGRAMERPIHAQQELIRDVFGQELLTIVKCQRLIVTHALAKGLLTGFTRHVSMFGFPVASSARGHACLDLIYTACKRFSSIQLAPLEASAVALYIAANAPSLGQHGSTSKFARKTILEISKLTNVSQDVIRMHRGLFVSSDGLGRLHMPSEDDILRWELHCQELRHNRRRQSRKPVDGADEIGRDESSSCASTTDMMRQVTVASPDDSSSCASTTLMMRRATVEARSSDVSDNATRTQTKTKKRKVQSTTPSRKPALAMLNESLSALGDAE